MTADPFVQLQVQPGLRGVTKLRWRSWRARNLLSFAGALAFLVAAGLLVLATHSTVADPPAWYPRVRLAATVALALWVITRLVLEGTVWKVPPGQVAPGDRQLFDAGWTPIHTSAGILLGLWLTPFLVVAALTVAWECLEISVPGFGDEEINGNRAGDILVAWLGWTVTCAVVAYALGERLPLI